MIWINNGIYVKSYLYAQKKYLEKPFKVKEKSTLIIRYTLQ